MRVNRQVRPEARLLMLCARRELDAPARQALIELLDADLNWPLVLEAADQHYISPLMTRHLLSNTQSALPESVRAELRSMQLRNAMRTLQLVRVQQQLVREVLLPRQVRHAFFKGAALAQQYYGDPVQRQYRDVDVLIDAARIAEVGEALLERGYQVSNDAWATFRQPDLRAFCRYHSALELRSPQGVLVELHKTLDSTGCIFSSSHLLDEGWVPEGSRYPWRTLAAADLFVYLCYHHARHRWSSLHWCADLDVVTRHADFDPAQVRTRAAAYALDATVEESLRLKQDLYQLALGQDLDSTRPPSRFLADCLWAVEGSLQGDSDPGFLWSESEADQHAGEREPDFLYVWQFSPRYRRRFRWLRWRPSANDVNAWPLPLSLHWLYYLTRPLRILTLRLRSLANR